MVFNCDQIAKMLKLEPGLLSLLKNEYEEFELTAVGLREVFCRVSVAEFFHSLDITPPLHSQFLSYISSLETCMSTFATR